MSRTKSEVSELNVARKGNRCIQIKTTGRMSREDVKKEAQQLSDDFFNRGIRGTIHVLLPFMETGWKTGKLTKVGEAISLFNPTEYNVEEPSHFNTFLLYLIPTDVVVKAGGCNGQENDCLWEEMMQICPEVIRSVYPTPESLKEAIGLDRTALVPLNKIHEIESKLPSSFKIVVSGNQGCTYTSTTRENAKKEIRLKLTKAHFTVDKKRDYKVHGVSPFEKKPIVYQYLDDGNVKLYNGIEYSNCTRKELEVNRRNTLSCPNSYTKLRSGLNLKQSYFNLYKTGGSITKAAYHLFLESNPTIHPDYIEQDEGEWISACSSGPLVWSEHGYQGPLYKYDVRKMYAAIMKYRAFLVPIKRGQFKKMTTQELNDASFIPPGIYKATVNGNHKCFKTNKRNYYTHYDLGFAKQLGLEFNLIQEENQPNALLYDGDKKINGSTLFKSYIEQVMKWIDKSKNEDKEIQMMVKGLYQKLWGFMGKKVYKKRTVKSKTINTYNQDNLKQELNDCDYVESTKPINDTNLHQIKFHNSQHIYDTHWARIVPFIISRGRSMVGNIMLPHIDNIKRVHTDGFYSVVELSFEKNGRQNLDNVKMGNDIGNISFEGFNQNATIHKLKKVQGFN
ncbi:hypothetical protein DFA_00301 [Cavenderia fasciculata]|uniref:DNA-directed DNA polymerase n=1 Tax=Cavenderia fasciculata TaxID=261658 RepID=F4PY63_CACFS|nr:uncharacterized protein DFA_00301 [Cavenderia fasciculata]EGG19723.1 hypothetical protein DFA_00301 [Cavenderia fasciculata]|eukprot:XP_004358017.1 hypothetical protein DFA_00301 [Cavenderia fasciculata]